MIPEGIYLSAYQGKINQTIVNKLIDNNIRFIGLRLTQDTSYIDKTWEHNLEMLRNTNILLFPWHFLTNSNAKKQTDHFLNQVTKYSGWQLPPALDCEAYTLSSFGEPISTQTLALNDPTVKVNLELAQPMKYVISPDGEQLGTYNVYNLSYPDEKVVDAMGRLITNWMATQPRYGNDKYPGIYTNCFTGNRWKTSSMSRYWLWVASWPKAGKPLLEKPSCVPNIWAKSSKPWRIHQNGIIDGAKYGIVGQTDHNLWNVDIYPFPGDEPTPPPPPPPPPTGKMYIVAYPKEGKFEGSINKA